MTATKTRRSPPRRPRQPKTRLPVYSRLWLVDPPVVTTPDGRRFEFVGTRAYTRLDGSLTRLLIWRGKCDVCGKPFEVCTPIRSVLTGSLQRRHCDVHKKRRTTT